MAPATTTETETTNHRPAAQVEPSQRALALKNDLIVGIKAIADELGVTKRKASYWHESGVLPTFKLRGSVCMRRSEASEVLRARPSDGEG
jgi:hypothetical protein